MGWNHGTVRGAKSGCECGPCSERREVEREKSAKYRSENRHVMERYREANREKAREAARKWREDNPERERLNRVQYYRNNRDSRIENQQMRDAVKEQTTAQTSKNHGKPWTDDERAYALDYSMTAMEVATRLGRTERSVVNIRVKAKRQQSTDNAQPTTEMDPQK